MMPSYSLELSPPCRGAVCRPLCHVSMPLRISIGSYSPLRWALRLGCWNKLAESLLWKSDAEPLVFAHFYDNFFPSLLALGSQGVDFRLPFPFIQQTLNACLLSARHSARRWENRNFTSSPDTAPAKSVQAVEGGKEL